MKDLPLSILSRGCGRLVPSGGGAEGRDGRLDVCFSPQDFDLWASKETLLRLSSRGRLFATIPKTYSTRRGALLLYSQELVSAETNRRPDLGARKKKVARRDTQQMKQRLSSLKELTAAILSYRNSRSFSSRLAPPVFAPLSLPPTLHHARPASAQAPEAAADPGLLLQLPPQWLPAKTSAETQAEGSEADTTEEQDSGRVRVDVFLQVPCGSRSPAPQPWVHYVATGPDNPEQHQPHTDDDLQLIGRSHHVLGSDPNVKGAAGDRDASTQDDRHPGDGDGCVKSAGKQKQQVTVKPEANTSSGLVPRHQKVSHSGLNGLDEPRREVSCPDDQRPHRLPPIADGRPLTPGQRSQAKAQPGAWGDPAGKLPLVLPPLFPETQETKQRKGREKSEKQPFRKGSLGRGGGGGGGRLPSDKGSMILLEPDEEPSPPVGVLGCVVGWKGPGKQSSLAFLQNRAPDLHEPGEPALVRGVLPLELRDFHNGKPAGCLILGPDGQIIQLSLNDTSGDSLQDDGDRQQQQQQALQVLSTEGEELPWVIVLQPDPADAGCELEPGPCDFPQPTHKDFVRGFFQGTESHLELGQFAAGELSFSTEQQVSDLPRSTGTNARSPRGHTDTVKVRKKKTKTVELLKTQKGAKNRLRMPPLLEQGGREELGGGSSDEEEEEEEEELSITDQSDHLYDSRHPRKKLQSFSPRETPTKDVAKWRKEKVTEEDAATSGESDTSAEESPRSNEQGRKEVKEEKQQKARSDDDQSVRGLGHDGSSREAAETQDPSAPSPKKKIKHRERGRREVKMAEEREDPASAKQKVFAGRRRKRRGRQTYAHLEVGNPNPAEDEEVGIQRQMPPGRLLSAPQASEDGTDADTDTDDRPTGDKRSCIQSVSSLRSSVPSSQRNPRSSVRSLGSFCERTAPASAVGHGRLSSCSTVMITEEQLMLNPVKPEFPQPTKSQQEDEAAALRLAQRAERRRQEVERQRRQREEDERKQQEKEQTEGRMKNELEEERRKRTEELRLKKLAEEEERRRQEQEEQEQARRKQVQRERERRRQEEMRRQIEQLHRMREQEEQRRKAELERLQLEEEKKQEEEKQRLQEMDEGERTEYLRRKEQEETDRKEEEEERTRTERETASSAAEEAKLQEELLARQMALLQQQLASKRHLMVEAGGLEKTQGISRPWIYSYFALFQLLGPSPVTAVTKAP